MGKSPKSEKRTYLIKAPRVEVFKRFAPHEIVLARAGRSVVLTSGDVPEEWVIDSLEGDKVGLVRDWVERSVLDDLHDEYLRNAPVPKSVQGAAIRRYLAAIERRAQAQKALERSIKLERDASAHLVRTFGKTSITIKGETLDPCYNQSEEVYFTRRRKAVKV